MPLKIRRFLFFFFFFYFCPFPFLLLSKNLLSLSFFLFFFLLFIFERGAQNIPSCDFSFSKALYTRTRGTLKRRRILEPAFSRDLRLTLSLITNKQMCTCVLFLKTRTSRSDSFQEPHKKAGKADFSATGARLKPPRQISSKIRSFSSDRRRKIQPSLEKSAIKQRKREKQKIDLWQRLVPAIPDLVVSPEQYGSLLALTIHLKLTGFHRFTAPGPQYNLGFSGARNRKASQEKKKKIERKA